MKHSDWMGLYASGLVVAVSGGIAFAVSAVAAIFVAALLHIALGLQTGLCFWIVFAAVLPLPLGEVLALRKITGPSPENMERMRVDRHGF